MDIANQTGGLVIGTGDLSELALGWATYNGDHMSMYGVNCGIPKTLVRHLVGWVAAKGPDEAARPWLLDILDTPISPELLPADGNGQIAQCTEELVGPYDLHDFFLYYFVRFGFRPAKLYLMARQAFAGKYEDRTIKRWLITFLRRFFLPTIQTLGTTRRTKSGFGKPLSARRLAYAQRCKLHNSGYTRPKTCNCKHITSLLQT